MTSLLTSISGQFGKVVFLGTLFPVLVVAILNDLLTIPLLSFGPGLQARLSRIAGGEDKWGAILLVFIVVVVTGFLYNLNIPIIRLYEGYTWKESWIGWFWTCRKKKQYRHARPLRLAMRYLRRQLQAVNPQDPLVRKVQSEQTALARYLNSGFPDREDLVLPTRFGNVIRCFERYANVAYGIDAIVLWPRLVSKIEAGFASTIDEAKTSVDFMINSSFLCAVSGLTVAMIGAFGRTPLSIPSVSQWIWRSLLFAGLSVVFYEFAIGRAKAWGEQVKSAFDLYRFDLLKSLGYQQQPTAYLEERALWNRISAQLLYADTRENPVAYKAGSTRISASPADVQLAVTRKLSPAIVSGSGNVAVTIENKDQRLVDFLLLTETLPDGYKLVLDSVGILDGQLDITNIAPLEMKIGAIAPAGHATVMYTIKSSAG
jgi:hypothetical protein